MAGKGNPEVRAMDIAWEAISNLEVDEQRRVMIWLIDSLKLSESVSLGAAAGGTANRTADAGSTTPTGALAPPGSTPKAFVASKKPTTDAERVICLAYYLTHYKNTPHFKTKDLKELNSEAAGAPFSNLGVAVNNAALSQYLAPAGKGNKQITVRGEAVVEALPEREKVKAALTDNPVRRRKPRKAKGGKSAR